MSVLCGFVSFAAWAQAEGGLWGRVWHYLNFRWHVAEFEFSIASIVVGLVVFVGALVFARVLGAYLGRRMEAQKRLDAGVRYSVLRLVTYTIIAAGTLLALRTSFHIDLTSLAVLFTALSVGIGFGSSRTWLTPSAARKSVSVTRSTSES